MVKTRLLSISAFAILTCVMETFPEDGKIFMCITFLSFLQTLKRILLDERIY